MQELFIDRVPCDLDDNTLITLDIKSNIFTMVDKIESNRTYSIELPRTDTNMRIMGNSDVLGANTNVPYVAHTCTYISDGVMLINEGTAYVLGIGERIRISIVWGVKDTLQAILSGDAKLKSLDGGNAILAYNYTNPSTRFSSEALLKAAGYIYAQHFNVRLPEDRHHETDRDILSWAIAVYHTPIVPCVRVPWLLGLVTNQYGIGFSMPLAVSSIVEKLVILISGTEVTEKSVSGSQFDGSSNVQGIVYGSNGLDITITTASLEFTNEDGTAISVGDTINRMKAVADTTAYVSVSNYVLSDSVQLTPNNIEILDTLLRTPLYVHNVTQGEYKAIATPTLEVDGVQVYKGNELRQWEGKTKTCVFTYNGAVEVQLNASDVLRLWHTGVRYSGIWDALNFVMYWQTGGTFAISYDIPDKMTVGMNYDIMANLPDVKIIDLIKHIAVSCGCFIRSLKADTSTLEFVPIADVYTNPAVDWSDRLLSARPVTADVVEFSYKDYAQANHYKYKANDDLQFSHDGTALIYNQQLQAETDVFTSVFGSADSIRTHAPLPTMFAWLPYTDLPNDWFDVYTHEKADPSTDAEKLLTGTPQATITSTVNVYDSGDAEWFSALAPATDMQAVIGTYYADMYATLNNCKVVTESMMLSDVDVRDFTEDTPVYLAKYGATFAVLEIKRTSGYLAEVKMLMLTKA